MVQCTKPGSLFLWNHKKILWTYFPVCRKSNMCGWLEQTTRTKQIKSYILGPSVFLQYKSWLIKWGNIHSPIWSYIRVLKPPVFLDCMELSWNHGAWTWTLVVFVILLGVIMGGRNGTLDLWKLTIASRSRTRRSGGEGCPARRHQWSVCMSVCSRLTHVTSLKLLAHPHISLTWNTKFNPCSNLMNHMQQNWSPMLRTIPSPCSKERKTAMKKALHRKTQKPHAHK